MDIECNGPFGLVLDELNKQVSRNYFFSFLHLEKRRIQRKVISLCDGMLCQTDRQTQITYFVLHTKLDLFKACWLDDDDGGGGG